MGALVVTAVLALAELQSPTGPARFGVVRDALYGALAYIESFATVPVSPRRARTGTQATARRAASHGGR